MCAIHMPTAMSIKHNRIQHNKFNLKTNTILKEKQHNSPTMHTVKKTEPKGEKVPRRDSIRKGVGIA